MPIDLDVVWLAGFMDGEGSFYVVATRTRGYLSYRPRVEVVNTHIPTVEHAARILGRWGPLQTATRNEADPKRKIRQSIYLVSWQACLAASVELLPYLITKQEQASILIEWATHRLVQYEATGRWRSPWTAEEHQWYQMLRDLNRRGPAPSVT